jgi:hypothetical protein
VVASVSAFADRSGLEEAERRLADWIEETVGTLDISPGEVSEAEVFAQHPSGAMSKGSGSALSPERLQRVRFVGVLLEAEDLAVAEREELGRSAPPPISSRIGSRRRSIRRRSGSSPGAWGEEYPSHLDKQQRRRRRCWLERDRHRLLHPRGWNTLAT